MTDLDRSDLVGPSHDGLVSLLSHDLRSPLAPLTLATSYIAEDESTSEDARALARIADSQGDRLRRLIDAALVASGRKPVVRLEHVELNQIAEEAAQVHRSLGGEAETKSGEGTVIADPALLKDAFANLLECGAGEGGSAHMTISIADGKAKAIVECRDINKCASALRETVPHDALSALLLGSLGIFELHDGGLELTDAGLIAWLPA